MLVKRKPCERKQFLCFCGATFASLTNATVLSKQASTCWIILGSWSRTVREESTRMNRDNWALLMVCMYTRNTSHAGSDVEAGAFVSACVLACLCMFSVVGLPVVVCVRAQ